VGRIGGVTLPPMQVHQTPTLLLTRPRAASERFSAGISGADVVISPLMEIVATGANVPLDGITGLVLTSENAVRFAPSADLPAFCVGPRTADAARVAGFVAEVMGPDASGLVRQLATRHPAGPLLHIHGTHTRGDVAGRLSATGIETRSVIAYDQQKVTPDATFHSALARPHLIIPLFSPRSADLFAKAATVLPKDALILALSQAVADALPKAMQAQTQVVAAANGAGMSAAMQRYGIVRNSP